ncbi:MAG: ABC transporter ATP-binding protein, partial [Candidatus Paceibacteria bacterium]
LLGRHFTDYLDINIPKGEFFALIGPNGAGKTTLIKLMGGLLVPDKGEITFNEVSMQNEPQRAKSYLAYIPDYPEIWYGMTGLEFLHFTGALYDIPFQERAERIQDLLEIYNLFGTEHKLFQDYSRGYKQKYAIIAALLHEPAVLLIDEPIVGLDPESIHVTEDVLSDFVAEGGNGIYGHSYPLCCSKRSY